MERLANNKNSHLGLQGFLLISLVLYYFFGRYLPGGYIIFSFVFCALGYIYMEYYMLNGRGSGPFALRFFSKVLPPLIFVSFISIILFTVFNWKNFPRLRVDAVGGLLFSQNFLQSKFIAPFFISNIQSPLSHLWVTSIIGQLSFIWFILLIGKRNKRKVSNIGIASVVIFFSSLIINIIYFFIIKDAWVYLPSIEVCLLPFSLGIISSIISNNIKISLSPENRDMFVAFLIIILFLEIFALRENIQFAIPGFVFSSAIFALILFLLKDGKSVFSDLIENSVFQFIGKKALLYFLWLFPVSYFSLQIQFFRGNYPLHIFATTILLILLVELNTFLSLKEKVVRNSSIVCCLLSMLIIFYSFQTQDVMARTVNIEEKKKTTNLLKKDEKQAIKKVKKESYKPPQEVEASVEQINARFPQFRLNLVDLQKLQSQAGIMIGDITTNEYEPEYSKIMPRVQYDGLKDRQMYQIIDLVKETAESLGNSNTPIILQFGKDADFNLESLEEVIKVAEGQRIILINVVTKDPWEDSVNEKFRIVAEKYENVFLVDWYSIAKEQGDFFEEENGEVKKSGQRLMTQMLAHTLLKTNVNSNKEIERITR